MRFFFTIKYHIIFRSLSERIGAVKKEKPLKQTKLNFEKSSPKKKGKNPWSDDDVSYEGGRERGKELGGREV